MSLEPGQQLVAPVLKRVDKTDPSVAFVVKLGCALHQYGTPAHRLEEAMNSVVQKLDLQGQFFSTPTGIFASFGAPEEQRTSLVRVEPGDVNLEKLAWLDDLAEQVIQGTVSPAEGARQVDQIVAASPRYGPLLTAMCFGLASGTASRFLGGGWREFVASVGIGTVLGFLALVAGRIAGVSRIYDFVAAIIASALATCAARFFSPFSIYVTVVAGLIVLVPGLTLTTAMTELATQNLVSGTARLTGAMLLFLQIGFGVAIGGQLTKLLPSALLVRESLPLPGWTIWIALLMSPLALTVLLKAHPRDVGWIVMAAWISFWGAREGGFLLGPEFGGCLGALCVGIGSNLYARWFKRPAAIPLVPGIMLLVPGSVGFGSLLKFLEKDTISGVEAAFRMVLIAVSLVSGLLLANSMVSPRKAL